MKLSILSTAALSLTVAAVPHKRSGHKHHRREPNVKTVKEVTVETKPAEIVYENEKRVPQFTWYQYTTVEPETGTTTTAAGTVTNTAPISTGTGGGSAGPGNGVCNGLPGQTVSYDPTNTDGSPKNESQISSDFATFSGYDRVRVYDANGPVADVMTAARANNLNVFLGTLLISTYEADVQKLVTALNGDWSNVDAVAIGNEALLSGDSKSAQQNVDAVNAARTTLRNAGFKGCVVTVEMYADVINNPILCQNSDFAAANGHAYYDTDYAPGSAGSFATEQVYTPLQSACSGKIVVLTETGWPWSMPPNLPAPLNRATSTTDHNSAITSLKGASKDNIVIFNAFNAAWQAQGQQWWGIYDAGSTTS